MGKDEDVKMVGQGGGRGGGGGMRIGDDGGDRNRGGGDGDVWDRDGRCETEVPGDGGGKPPSSSKEARDEVMVLALFCSE